MKVSPELERRILELAGELPVQTIAPRPVPSSPRRPAASVELASVRLVVWIPGLRVRSEANIGGELRGKIARKIALKDAVRRALACSMIPLFRPVRVVLTRIGSKRLDDDNLAHAFKAVRDAVSDWLGVDDGDREAVRWVYKQRAGYVAGVRIAVG